LGSLGQQEKIFFFPFLLVAEEAAAQKEAESGEWQCGMEFRSELSMVLCYSTSSVLGTLLIKMAVQIVRRVEVFTFHETS